MKHGKIMITILAFMLYISASAQDVIKKENTKKHPAIYTCVMHPEIHITKPGNCPRCGMKLVKEKAKAINNDAAKKIDMGKTDSTGMKEMKPDENKTNQAATYTCAMHP